MGLLHINKHEVGALYFRIWDTLYMLKSKFRSQLKCIECVGKLIIERK